MGNRKEKKIIIYTTYSGKKLNFYNIIPTCKHNVTNKLLKDKIIYIKSHKSMSECRFFIIKGTYYGGHKLYGKKLF